MEKYLGKSAATLLAAPPFAGWEYERSVESDLDRPAVLYIFTNKGLEVRCNENDEVESLFCTSGNFDESLIEFSFANKRNDVMAILGEPEKSGNKMEDPILGNYGAWDRFNRGETTIHFQYAFSNDETEKITFMLSSVAP